MAQEQHLMFGPFQLDPVNARLWRDGLEVRLRPKAFAMLRYVVEHPGRLVTKAELLKAVWAGTYVTPTVFRVCLHEIREVLREDATAPRFIETIPRQGYRFIAPVTTSGIVGREAELGQLRNYLEKALGGERQIVFVTGEAGIGKTTLVDAFLAKLGARGWGLGASLASSQAPSPKSLAPSLWIGRGQCIEHYSASEAYLPVLEAFGRLCRAPDGERLIAILQQHAPLWLAQLPSVLTAAEREALQRQVVRATQERMLREMAEAIEELTARQPFVLWLEDLHGSDYATLDLLAFLARRREPARLLVLGTYRPLAVQTGEHPLYTIQRELQVRGQCHELALEPLGEAAVAQYLAARLPRTPSLARLARVIHQRTEGNPLFMVSVVETLLKQEELGHETEAVSRTVPANIRQFIEQQAGRLRPEQQQLLEVASVAGVEYSAAAIAAGLLEKVTAVESCCEELTRRGYFVQDRGSEEWPDGTVATRYRFVHALYQEVLYARVTAARRSELHRRIGERIEQGYGKRAGEQAAELAMHFERGRDYARAVQYLRYAGEKAAWRSAYVEASTHFAKGLALLPTLPDTPDRVQQEFTLQVAYGGALMATKGYAAPAVERVYLRARDLCQQVEKTPQLFPTLRGLWAFFLVRAQHRTAQELGQQLFRLAQTSHDQMFLLEAHQTLGITSCFLGELAAAQEDLEQSIALSDPHQSRAVAFLYAYDPAATCLAVSAWILWFRGYPDQALARTEEALILARKLSHPISLGAVLFCCAVVSQHCHRQGQAALQWAEEVVDLSTAQEFPFWLAGGLILRGALLARREQRETVIMQIPQGLAAFAATGAEIMRPYFLALLAEAYQQSGQIEEGLRVITEALAIVDKSGERYYEAELWRLKGELTLQQLPVPSSQLLVQEKQKANGKGQKVQITNPQPPIPDPQAEAEECFHKAIAIARRQGAKSLELRAVMSMARLWQRQGEKKQARQMLAAIYGWFTEGFETADLQEARVLLEA